MANANSTIGHGWYYNNDPEHCAHGSNYFYEGFVIYSFGLHYPIARKVNGSRGIILFQCENDWGGYTARHRNHTTGAIDDNVSEVYYVEDVMADTPRAHLNNHNNYYDRLRAQADKWPRAREGKRWIADSIEHMCRKANEYAVEFQIEVVTDLCMTDFLPRDYRDDLEIMEARVAEREIAVTEQRKVQRERELERYKERKDAWQRGENVHIPHMYGLPAILRIKDGVVQTSQGAEFPIKYAKLAWRVIKNCVSEQETWRSNGEKVQLGIYRLDSVDADGNIRAGCHTVEYHEIWRIACLLGLPGTIKLVKTTDGGVA